MFLHPLCFLYVWGKKIGSHLYFTLLEFLSTQALLLDDIKEKLIIQLKETQFQCSHLMS